MLTDTTTIFEPLITENVTRVSDSGCTGMFSVAINAVYQVYHASLESIPCHTENVPVHLEPIIHIYQQILANITYCLPRSI